MDDRSAMSQAFAWSSRVITISLEMALPGALGLWVDEKLGTAPICLILGVAIGMTVGMSHLLHLAKTGTGGRSPGEDDTKTSPSAPLTKGRGPGATPPDDPAEPPFDR